MIGPEQLAAALERLDARDTELLTLSLRRRVPDEALARVFDCEPADIARRRAGAIERLADELGVQRGEELGAVLKALLEPENWGEAGAEFEPAPKRGLAAPDPEPAPAFLVTGPRRRRPEIQAGTPPQAAPKALAPPPDQGRAAQPPPAAPQQRRRRLIAVAATAAIAAVAGTVAFVGAAELADDSAPERPKTPTAAEQPPSFEPRKERLEAAPFASDPKQSRCYTTAYVRGSTTLYRRPGGPRRVRIAARTEFGSPRVLGVVRQSNGWLKVQAPELRNGEDAWVSRDRARLDCVRWTLHLDRSKRLLVVRKNGRSVRRWRVAVGRPGNATPLGRFSVTDKLRVKDPGSPYGCCVLALSGHQTDLPADWPGGDRLAVHATRDLGSIGRAASLGCMRTSTRRARWLIDTIPLGAPIFIRA